MAILRPAGDISAGTWENQAGSATNLYLAIDEASTSDGDYVEEQNGPPTPVAYRAQLSAGVDPGIDTGHSIFVRAKHITGGENMAVGLYQGGGIIKSFTIMPTTSFGNFVLNLSSLEAANITDYTDLELRFGGPRMFVSQAYLDIPDAGVSDHLDASAPGLAVEAAGSGHYVELDGPGLRRVAGIEGATALLVSAPGYVVS